MALRLGHANALGLCHASIGPSPISCQSLIDRLSNKHINDLHVINLHKNREQR